MSGVETFTVISSPYNGAGKSRVTVYDYVECDGDDLKEAIEKAGIDAGTIWFIFRGKCEVA